MSWWSIRVCSAASRRWWSTSAGSRISIACANRSNGPSCSNIAAAIGVSGIAPTPPPGSSTSTGAVCSPAIAASRGNGLAFEHVPGGEHEPGRLGARDQLDRGDAVAAEREEAVVGTHLGHAEDLAEQRRESALGVGAGRAGDPAASREIRCRQGLAVELADRGERQRVEHGDRGGHHVAGQELADVGLQCRRVDGGARPGEHVGGQRGRTVRGSGPDGGGERDGVVLLEPSRRSRRARSAGRGSSPGSRCGRGTPALGAGAEPAERPETIGKARPTHQVTGAVQPCPRSERVRDEPRRREVDATAVAAGDAGPGEVQLAR